MRNESTEFFDAIGGGFVAAIDGIFDICRTFGDVNMNADAEFTGFVTGVFNCIVRAGELGMQANQTFDERTLVFFDKADAFIDAAFTFAFAEIAVGCAVCQKAAGTKFFIGIGQGIE